ncbi:MAG: chromate resistance protein [Magnetococcales bacterium]|nr:chromate resistance protein [Magnetococcales bacterium]
MERTIPFLVLILSLPSRNATERMRAWRALKAWGCVVLRDGVYLLPASDDHQQRLMALADEVVESGGQAEVLWVTPHSPPQEEVFRALFDRSGDYAALQAEMDRLDPAFPDANHLKKALRSLRRHLVEVVGIDFFPSSARQETETRLFELEATLNARLSPGEPRRTLGEIERLTPDEFQECLWTTRRDLGVDRLTSAWLIRRFIDPRARFVWFSHQEGAPPEAIGFDFDGARFSHIGARITFETLLASFGLEENQSLLPIARMVHFLDVGEGSAAGEAAGFQALFRGMKARLTDDDDTLLEEGSRILDDYYFAFSNPEEQS